MYIYIYSIVFILQIYLLQLIVILILHCPTHPNVHLIRIVGDPKSVRII